jgi:DNA-directed RNA polymerase subunit RPC12/RpoP
MNKDGFNEIIELRCSKCNMKIMDYMIQHEDTACALNGVSLKCSRCKRVITLMKYTEAIIKHGSVIANGNLVRKI